MAKISIEGREVAREYSVVVGRDILADAGKWARQCLGSGNLSVAIVSDKNVFSLYGDQTVSALRSDGFEVSTLAVLPGETSKSLKELENVLSFLNETRISRSDVVLALGGGVVGDLAGFAAAVHLRGVPFLSIPTTLLSMVDASVGGKTAVNLGHRKNLVGAFHSPRGVLADIEVLETMDRREVVSGLFECVKQAIVAGDPLFSSTRKFVCSHGADAFLPGVKDRELLVSTEEFVASHIRFKASIVKKDEFEESNREEKFSRMVLNFGHTLGHAIESATAFGTFTHGEAVGAGMRFAILLSNLLDFLSNDSLKLLNDVIRNVGDIPATDNIDIDRLQTAIFSDKKVKTRRLQWVLLDDIGRPRFTCHDDIPRDLFTSALTDFLKNGSTTPTTPHESTRTQR